MNKLDQHDVSGATAIAMVMLVVSFVLLFAINMLQARSRRFLETS
jgi:sulfate transport system permease protein